MRQVHCMDLVPVRACNTNSRRRKIKEKKIFFLSHVIVDDDFLFPLKFSAACQDI